MSGWAWLWALAWLLPVYIYVIYPLLCRWWARHASPPGTIVTDAGCPPLTVICVYHNEEAVLPEKISNTLALDYPAARLRVLFVSDASSDGGDAIIAAEPRVQLVRCEPRGGKCAALNKVLIDEQRRAPLDTVVLLTDANTILAPDAARRLVSRLADPGVRFACGRLRLVNAGGGRLGEWERRYWEGEQLLKHGEGSRGILVGANGGLYAFRLRAYEHIDDTRLLMEDLFIPLRLLHGGGRGVYVPDAVALEAVARSDTLEYQRKRRIATANFSMLPRLLRLHVPAGTLAALWSHKILRWLFPFCWPFLLLGSWLTLPGPATAGIAVFHLVVFALAAAGRYVPPLAGFYYGITMNGALLAGGLHALLGHPHPYWDTVRR